jgi:hypothetical protein
MSAPNFRNRIVGHGEEAPDQLLANPANWRIHPKAQQDALAGVLEEVGWVQNVIVNQRTGFLLDGHLRVQVALRDGVEKIPVTYVELSPTEEALILATFDPLAAMAGTDQEKLAELLHEVGTGSADVQAMLGNLARESGVTAPDFAAVDAATQPRLDEKKKIKCPACDHEFTA